MHLFGRPLDWEALQTAVPPEVPLVEDAAGALGARWQGMPCGGLGVLGCLSFHPRKIVTTGEGGAVTTDDAELADAVRRLRHHGIDPRTATSPEPGDELPARGHPLRGRHPAAAPPRRAARRAGARRGGLRGAAARTRRARRPPTTATRTAGRRTSSGSTAATRRSQALRAEGIEAQIGTYALHRLSAYRDQGAFPGADAAFERALALPLHSRLTDDDLDRVAEGLARFA